MEPMAKRRPKEIRLTPEETMALDRAVRALRQAKVEVRRAGTQLVLGKSLGVPAALRSNAVVLRIPRQGRYLIRPTSDHDDDLRRFISAARSAIATPKDHLAQLSELFARQGVHLHQGSAAVGRYKLETALLCDGRPLVG